MHDDFLSAVWADRHGAVSTSFRDLFKSVRTAFEWLAARNYDAPWKREVAQKVRSAAAGENGCIDRSHSLS